MIGCAAGRVKWPIDEAGPTIRHVVRGSPASDASRRGRIECPSVVRGSSASDDLAELVDSLMRVEVGVRGRSASDDPRL